MSRKPRAIITRLRASNFRSIEWIDLKLGPLNVLVGQNGVGKSNIIDALRFIRDCLTKGVDQALLDRGGMGAVQRFGSQSPDSDILLEVECTFGRYEVLYGFTLAPNPRTEYKILEEHLQVRSTESGAVIGVLHLVNGQWIGDAISNELQLRSYPDTELHMLRTWWLYMGLLPADPEWAVRATFGLVADMSFYNISPESLRTPQQIVSESPFDEKGRNLAAVLRSVKRGEGPELNDIEGALARLVDGLRSYDIHNVGSYLVTRLHYEFPDVTTAADQARVTRLASDLAQESDGTLRILSILAALYQKPSRGLVVIEEPEINIHPGALGVIADLLQEARLRSQILVTTHNPDLIGQFMPDVLRVVEKSDGVTHVGPVAQDQQEAIREMLFSTAEIMKMEGLRREAAGV
ncbi:MAG TPA: AAA family ATPase [Longimicrobium sp.]|jgi:predicted ATPase